MKIVALGLLVLLLMIPLSIVRSTIMERSDFQHVARADIARSWGGEQQVVGPMLVQTYEVPVSVQVWDENREEYVERVTWEKRRAVAYPETLVVEGEVNVEHRYRGIYAVPVYRAELRLRSALTVPAAPGAARNVENEVVVAVSDARGLRQQPAITWEGERLRVHPGTGTALRRGVRATVPVEAEGASEVDVALVLAGSNRMAVAPIGGDTAMTLRSNWPHPGFSGGYLPESHEIDAEGFQAEWKTSYYAAAVRETISTCLQGGSCALGEIEMIALELTNPVSIYLLNERSVKYGLLFLAVIFAVFLVYELLERLRIHPVQYSLVGLGQALFFLLLLSLSEHVAFSIAYLAGAMACIGLLAFYVAHVLRSWLRALGFASLLAAVYAALYVILQSEDHALLLGSLLLFGLLAAAMCLTRNVDWYALEMPKFRSSDAA